MSNAAPILPSKRSLKLLVWRMLSARFPAPAERMAVSVKLVQVLLQVLLGEAVAYVGEAVEHRLEIHPGDTGEAEDLRDLLPDLEEDDVAEGERAVRDHRLELHAQGLRLVTYLHQVRAPVEGVLGIPEHHPGDGPHLRHDTRRDQVVDPAVIPVLRGALPEAEVREGPAPEILVGEDCSGRGLRALVVLEDGLHLFIVESLPGSTGAVCGLHGRRRLQVDVDAVILCPERRRDAQEHKDYHGDDKPSHLFGT